MVPARPMVLAFCFGAFATVAQVVLLREVMVVLGGNELSLALSLAAWLIGVGAGAAVGGRLAGGAAGGALLAVAGGALALATSAAVVLVRATRHVLGVEPGVVVSPGLAALVCVAALAPASLGAGLCFAPLVSVAGQRARGGAAAAVYAAEGAGAFSGGLLFTLGLAGRVGSLPVLAGAGAALTAACAVALLWDRRLVAGGLCAAIAALGLAGLVAGLWSALDERTAAARWRSAAGVGQLVAQRETPYQRLELARHETQLDLYANGAPLLSFPDPYEREGPVHVAMTQHPGPARRVLLIGGGVADRVAAALEHEPEAVDYVGLDPAEIDLLRVDRVEGAGLPARDLRALGDPRVRLIEGDGRRFVTRARPGTYDLVVVETPDPVTALANRYYTLEFHRACARALAPDGVLAARIGSSADFGQADVGAPAAVLYQSLRQVFGHVAVWPGQDMRLYASSRPGVVSDDPGQLATRWRGRWEAIRGFSEHRFGSLFDPELVSLAHARLGQLPAPANTDARPVAVLYGLVLWDQRARGAGQVSPLWVLHRAGLGWLLVPLLALAAGRALLGLRGRRRGAGRDGLWATLTGGLAGLALEVMLLLIFQDAEGSLYSALGVLVALFMLGLTAGTLLLRRWCRDRGRLRRLGAGVDVATILVIVATPALAWAGPAAGWLAGAWLVAAGLCTGAVFPPAVADLGRRLDPARAAGLADAADHVGACLGALAFGLLLLPVAGLWGAALALALLKATSLVGWLRPEAPAGERAEG